jgi:hypothetical protein
LDLIKYTTIPTEGIERSSNASRCTQSVLSNLCTLPHFSKQQRGEWRGEQTGALVEEGRLWGGLMRKEDEMIMCSSYKDGLWKLKAQKLLQPHLQNTRGRGSSTQPGKGRLLQCCCPPALQNASSPPAKVVLIKLFLKAV